MIIAMLLAHLFGDYILQWDNLSRWKSQALSGVLVHGAIVLGVTWLFSLPFDGQWWPWVLLIGLTHTLIDGLELPLRRRLAAGKPGMSALALFVGDQFLHLVIITLSLVASGYLKTPALVAGLLAALSDNRTLAYVLGYAFLTMPAWVLIEFAAYGLIKGTAPDFSQAIKNKYVSILERGLMATFVLLGQFLLVPLVALPRLLVEWPQVVSQRVDGQRATVYVAELLASVTLAVAIGLGLRLL
ncbi:MAG: DUF3307 domain-containing protein [Chloroflexi bacterium]|nr:DUF3307 domain-containing protein [Chloroflexota bacterium]MCI0577923.1 DUF3307 domain-containing protein [Chloroflexota bacterium]MCI0645803.1 DUF3307 domain-containing protein [Chloroflexota bacterium]MCI0727272.1 DUF3307 domain-containing protein [Chloroflexota bacterium]